MTFTLHPALAKDTLLLGRFPLCLVTLMNSASFPWVILVPAENNLSEITDLNAPRRIALMEEIHHTASIMQKIYAPDKMNIATLGNKVPQLHIHVIARFTTDEKWPDPVWGYPVKPYTETGKEETLHILGREFSKLEYFTAF